MRRGREGGGERRRGHGGARNPNPEAARLADRLRPSEDKAPRFGVMRMDEALERNVFAEDAPTKEGGKQQEEEEKGGTDAKAQAEVECWHYSNKDIAHLNIARLQILSSRNAASCEHCREDAPTKQRGKERGGKEEEEEEEKKKKKKKKKGGGARSAAAKEQAKAEKSHVWVCLLCSRHFCGGADTEPHGHVRAHCWENKHWWAANYDDPTLVYCFKCRVEVSLKIPDFSPSQKKDKAKSQTVLPLDATADLEPNTTSFELKGAELDWRWSSDSDWDEETTTTKPVEGKGSSIPVQMPSPPSDQMDDPELKTPPPLVIFKSAADLMDEGSHLTKTRDNIINGLPNLGNTCFFNVVLQILLALGSLRRTILRPDVRTGPLARLLKELFLQTSASSEAGGALDPRKLFMAFCSNYKQFRGGGMQCNHEFFCCFCESLRHEETEEWKLAKNASTAQFTTIVDFIFMGMQSSTVSSTECSHYSSTEHPFDDLMLTVPSRPTEGIDDEVDDSNGPVSVEDCLTMYFGEGPISGWCCTDCTVSAENSERREDTEKVERAANKRLLISKAPTVLAISLGRVTSIGNQIKKLKGHVSFREMLDIHPFVDPRSKDVGNTKYHLVGVAQHNGTPEKGHYTAYVRSGKSWFYTSDMEVREVYLDEVLSCEAFLLFYERVGDLDSPPPALLVEEDEWTVVVDKKKDQKERKTNKNLTLPAPLPPQGYKNPNRGGRVPLEFQKHDKNLEGVTIDPIAAPTMVEELSKVQQGGKATFSAVTMMRTNAEVAKDFQRFLDEFVCPGESMPHYHCHLKGILSSGSSSYVLHVPYSHIRQFSRNLAMTVCNGYKRLKKSLEAAARTFMKQSFPMGSEPKLTLKILELPVMHESWKVYRRRIYILKAMEVYAHTRSTIYIPTPEATLMLQGILWHMLGKHKSGLSWNGNFSIDDVEVFNGNIFIITKPPQKFTNSDELRKAMERDFLTYAKSFLSEFLKFLSNDREVPYLHMFDLMLRNMEEYADMWSNDDLAESFRDLIGHHLFLKPPIVTAYLLSGIYTACRSYDLGDPAAIFKEFLKLHCGLTEWTQKIHMWSNDDLAESFRDFKKKKADERKKAKDKQSSDRFVIEYEDYDNWLQGEKLEDDLKSFAKFMRQWTQKTYMSRNSVIKKKKADERKKAKDKQPSDRVVLENEDYDNLLQSEKFEDDLESFVEFMRHLFRHGPDHSKEERKLLVGSDGKFFDPNKKPQEQYMRNLEETEVAAALDVGHHVCNLMILLVRTQSIQGMLVPVWRAYKSYCSSSTPMGESAMEQWLLMQLDDDDYDEE